MNSSHSNLFNLIALIVSPNSPCDESGTAKLFRAKATKFSKICDDIESLISNSEPSLSEVFLSLNIYGKTGSSEIMTNLHRVSHGLSYTETNLSRINGSYGAKNNQASAK